MSKQSDGTGPEVEEEKEEEEVSVCRNGERISGLEEEEEEVKDEEDMNVCRYNYVCRMTCLADARRRQGSQDSRRKGHRLKTQGFRI